MWLCDPGRPITYGILKPGPHQPDGVPYVRVADFSNDQLRLSDIRRTTPAIADAYRRSTLGQGDVLLSIRGTFGRLCRVPPGLEGANITQDTARLSIHSLVNPDYVVICLTSPDTQDRMRRAARGVAVRGLNIGDVRALQVALPTREEQNEIVRRVHELFGVAAVIEERLATASASAQGLSQAVLAKAFRGELATIGAGRLPRPAGRIMASGSMPSAREGSRHPNTLAHSGVLGTREGSDRYGARPKLGTIDCPPMILRRPGEPPRLCTVREKSTFTTPASSS